MKRTLLYIIGTLCSWLALLCMLAAMLQAAITMFCLIMMQVDQSASNTWNCGVTIYASLLIAYTSCAVLFSVLSILRLGIGWWKLPFRQIRSFFVKKTGD